MGKCYGCKKKAYLLLQPRKKSKRKKNDVIGNQTNIGMKVDQRERVMKIGVGTEAIGHRTIDKVATEKKGALVTATTTRIESGGERTKMVPNDPIVVVIEMTLKKTRVDGMCVEDLVVTTKGETNAMKEGGTNGVPLNREEKIKMEDVKSDGKNAEDHQSKKRNQRKTAPIIQKQTHLQDPATKRNVNPKMEMQIQRMTEMMKSRVATLLGDAGSDLESDLESAMDPERDSVTVLETARSLHIEIMIVMAIDVAIVIRIGKGVVKLGVERENGMAAIANSRTEKQIVEIVTFQMRDHRLIGPATDEELFATSRMDHGESP